MMNDTTTISYDDIFHAYFQWYWYRNMAVFSIACHRNPLTSLAADNNKCQYCVLMILASIITMSWVIFLFFFFQFFIKEIREVCLVETKTRPITHEISRIFMTRFCRINWQRWQRNSPTLSHNVRESCKLQTNVIASLFIGRQANDFTRFPFTHIILRVLFVVSLECVCVCLVLIRFFFIEQTTIWIVVAMLEIAF